MTNAMPGVRPAVPHFSSGPCAKRPGWTLQNLNDAVLGRSHRSKLGKAKLKRAIDRTREVLRSAGRLPHRHRPGLRHRRRRDGDVVAARRARRSPCSPGNPSAKAGSPTSPSSSSSRTSRVLKAGYGELPDLAKVDLDDRRGVHLERHHLGRARAERRLDPRRPRGLTICDATSACFRAERSTGTSSMSSPSPGRRCWAAKAAHGMLILSPRAVARLESYTPPWPLPKIFRMTKGGKLIEGIFEGETINTPSMLASKIISTRSAGRSRSAACAPDGALPTPTRRRSPTGSRARRGSISWPPIRRSAPTPRCA